MNSDTVLIRLVLSGVLGLMCAMVLHAAEPWESPYEGEEATGPDVIGLWQFAPDAEAADSSGKGHNLTLRGDARVVAEGRFDGALEATGGPGGPNETACGALAADTDALTPAGAFSLEAWINPRVDLGQVERCFVLDKMYVDYKHSNPNTECLRDYMLLFRGGGDGRARLEAAVGFGDDVVRYSTDALEFPVGRWTHVAFTYDGAGRGRLYRNGDLVGGGEATGRGPISAGRYGLTIGDRHGSTYASFPGLIDQVRICNGIPSAFSDTFWVALSGRCAFERMEQDAALRMAIDYQGKVEVQGLKGTIRIGDEAETALPLPESITGPTECSAPVNTHLRPGSYPFVIVVEATVGQRQVRRERTGSVVIVPRPLPHRMPVVSWAGGCKPADMLDIGFTSCLGGMVNARKVWDAEAPTEAQETSGIAGVLSRLDEMAANGLTLAGTLQPARDAIRFDPALGRYDRDGNLIEGDNVNGNFPRVREFCHDYGAAAGISFGDHPAFESALIHSEVRDASQLSFHEVDRAAYRVATGREFPEEAQAKGGVPYAMVPQIGVDRLVDDDHPILEFYRWFWKEGDGWNGLHTATHEGLKSTSKRPIWTWFDPGVRVPSIWGSGGDVDYISQWTYSYPDPIKIGQATDELFAMHDGSPPNQDVMKMTQIIWYRTQTAPNLPEDEGDRAEWEKVAPEAKFISIAPDHLKEAFWGMISRPVKGIMYHGWGSLVGELGSLGGSYCMTNPETRVALTEVLHQVAEPLGATLVQVPDRPSDVALLESFTSQVFAGRGSWGWGNSWEADMHLILQWAQLQPRIIYEEKVLRDGLDDYKVLVMPCCDVLPRSVAEQVRQFQARGGIVVADEFLAPAITPDIVIRRYSRVREADKDKAALQELAAALRHELDDFYTRYGESSNPDVVVRLRRAGAADYLFAINDTRTFGDYVGHHKLVMEKGLATEAVLSVRRPGATVYDLVAHQKVPTTSTADGLSIDAAFGPGEGRLFMLTDRPIAGVRVNVAPPTEQTPEYRFSVTVVDEAGAPISAVVPVEVELLDPEGRRAEPSGYYGAGEGGLAFGYEPAPNDLRGDWTLRVTELAGGAGAVQTVSL